MMKEMVEKLIELHELLHRLKENYGTLRVYKDLVDLDEDVLRGKFGKLSEEEYKEREKELSDHQKMLSDIEKKIEETEKKICSLLVEIVQKSGGKVLESKER